MESLMSACCGALRKSSLVAGCLFLALMPILAQTSFAQDAARKPAAETPAATLNLMVEKGHALEARGRPDLAIEVWQQVLLSDPKNVDSLVGMARDLKLTGSDKAIDALDRLRKVSPNNPDILKIEGLASTHAESAWLRQAADFAKQGKNDDAMRIYRQLYRDRPPDGDIALAYYQTLYGTANGKPEATAAMRALAQRNPGDSRFAVELGVMLTYTQTTRGEGIRLLKEYSKEQIAQAALRQALVWDAANLSSVPELRDYLKDHPEDTELAACLKENETKLAQMNTGIGRTPAERAAYAALDAHHLDDAENRFTAILDEDPANGRAAAGMGFLRMQQKNFADAINYFTRAVQNGFKERVVEDAMAAAHFWNVMADATEAMKGNRLDIAGAMFQEALGIRPHSPEALNGLAGTLTKQQQYAQAALIYDQLTRVQPDSTDGWRGLFLAYAHDRKNDQALAVEERIPASVKAALAKDLDYLSKLATIYQAEDRTADAQRVFAEALALPFPNNGTTLKADTKLEYASIFMQVRRYDQAVTLYTQLLSDDPGNLSAWMGLLRAHHEMGQVAQAIADVEKMTPAVHQSALADPAFLILLGSIYQQAGQYEVAQGLLERAAKMQIAAGSQAGLQMQAQLQLAGIYIERNDTVHAFAIYQQVLKSNPDSTDAWKGLIAALEATDRNAEALQQLSLIPTAARRQLDADIDFAQTESAVYAATGDTVRANALMNRVQAHYAKLHTLPPADVEIQNASLLLSAGNEHALFQALMELGGRADLSVAKRQAIQEIWANWAVRRAAAALDSGSAQRAVDILDAASLAFPTNITVRKAAAASYVQVGRGRESLAIYKFIPMDKLTAADFQAAVDAAFEGSDMTQAGVWLRQALQRFPHDPALLLLAGRYEQARGDNQGAADYERAAVAVMPPGSPVDQLAQVLVYPDQETKTHRTMTAADLERLLDPDDEPFAKVTTIQPLHASERYEVAAPMVLTPAQPQARTNSAPQTPQKPDAPKIFPPSASQGQTPTTSVYVPQS
jgi:tetratricopeptide (TPR) repeat protein